MSKVGVFITTHIHDSKFGNYRHGPEFGQNTLPRFKKMLSNYKNLDSGEDDTIHIMDTESTLQEFIDWIPTEDWATWKQIPNVGGGFASIKHVMHAESNLMDEFDYFLFHTDDSVYVRYSNWAKEVIEEYEESFRETGGIIGRKLETIVLGPDGLVNNGRQCSHMAEIWNLSENTIVPHLHADWYFMDKRTLKILSDIWYNPIHSEVAMDYQKRIENLDYRTMCMIPDNRKTLDDFHIGRETDTALRLEHFGLGCKSYTGDKIIWGKGIE